MADEDTPDEEFEVEPPEEEFDAEAADLDDAIVDDEPEDEDEEFEELEVVAAAAPAAPAKKATATKTRKSSDDDDEDEEDDDLDPDDVEADLDTILKDRIAAQPDEADDEDDEEQPEPAGRPQTDALLRLRLRGCIRVSKRSERAMRTDNDKTPVDQAADLFVYAPIGLFFEAPSLLPKLAEQGRVHARNARLFGQFAVRQGEAEVRRRLA